jgi:DtxR family transcriptional regulator, Mn-dependent transcriptional regulator
VTAAERYCETIFELAEDDIEVLQVRIAERLGVSRPAVSEMTARLADDGYVTVNAGRLELTEPGRRLAESAVRRHRLAERFLVDVLGLGWAEAHDAAANWQGVIDDRTEPAMVRLLGDPATCPHGNPIPGHELGDDGGDDMGGDRGHDRVTLASMAVGDVGQVARVTERLEVEPGMLRTLERAGLIPGTRVEVLSVSPDGTLAVRASRQVLSLSSRTADAIMVRPGDLDAVSRELARGAR